MSIFQSEILQWIIFGASILITGGGITIIRSLIKNVKQAWKKGESSYKIRQEAAADGEITKEELLEIKKADDEFFKEFGEVITDATKLWSLFKNKKKPKKLRQKIRAISDIIYIGSKLASKLVITIEMRIGIEA